LSSLKPMRRSPIRKGNSPCSQQRI
jgi:hypothetical protein